MAKPPNLRALRPHEVGGSLVDCLVGTVDQARQLYTDLGLRPYRVFLVWLEWSADENGDGRITGDERYLNDGEPGAGRAIVLQEVELLPVPRVTSLTGVSEDRDAVGLTERGGVSVSEISPSYSESLLRGLHPSLVDPSNPGALRSGVEFFYEVATVRPMRGAPGTAGGSLPDASPPLRRRFHLTTVPSRDAGGFQWALSLVRADGDRTADGRVLL